MASLIFCQIEQIICFFFMQNKTTNFAYMSPYNRVTLNWAFWWCFQNLHFEIPTLNRSKSTIKIGSSSPLYGKTSESTLVQTATNMGWTMYEIDSYHEALKSVCTVFWKNIWFFFNLKKSSKLTTENGTITNKFKFELDLHRFPTGLGTIPIGKSVGISLENAPKFRVHNLTP